MARRYHGHPRAAARLQDQHGRRDAGPAHAPAQRGQPAFRLPQSRSLRIAGRPGRAGGRRQREGGANRGPVQVQVSMAVGRIADARALTYPSGNGHDTAINGYALPRCARRCSPRRSTRSAAPPSPATSAVNPCRPRWTRHTSTADLVRNGGATSTSTPPRSPGAFCSTTNYSPRCSASIAERMGAKAGRLRPRVLAGMVVGAERAAVMYWMQAPESSLVHAVRTAVRQATAGAGGTS